jgi:hypothetical protein
MSDPLDRLCRASFAIDPAWGDDMRVLLPDSLAHPLPPVGAVRLMLDKLESQQASVRQLIVYV